VLVLTRKIHETIIIAENTPVTIMDIHGRKVRLAIEAPQEVAILREEFVRMRGQAPRVSSRARRGRLDLRETSPVMTPTTISRNGNCSLSN
jgi:carbon storage regulator